MQWFESFRDKVVVVTGASSGIGRATALAFGAAGAKVALVARRRGLLEEVATEVSEAGGRGLAIPADVTRREDVRACFDQVYEELGPIDIVVNNAGILIAGTVVDLDPTDLDAMLRVNLIGSLFVMQEAVRKMRQHGGGCIVNVASLAGRRGVSPLGGYCASKFALVGLTEALRHELQGEAIHVGLVLPGIVDTPMADQMAHEPDLHDFWPGVLNMPPSWVVWAIFAVARFRLIEISVPPGAATLEKLAAISPGIADTVVSWARTTSSWLVGLLGR